MHVIPNLKVAFLMALSALSLAASAMTQAELQAAIDAAESGATVEVSSDVSISSALSFTKSVTLRSPAGQTNVVRRTSAVMMLTNSTADITIKLTDLALDGNAPTVKGARAIRLTAGTLELDAGASVRNVDIGTTYGGILLESTGHLVLNDGAEIRGFTGKNYATCVLIGEQGGGNKGTAVFDMRGGLITGCQGNYGNAAVDMDGTVYVYGGVFNMSGGVITGNSSVKCNAGVCVYSGTINLSGNASITNNVGGRINDLYLNAGGMSDSSIAPGYTGSCTLYTVQEPVSDKHTDSRGWLSKLFKSPAARVAGLGRIVNQNWPAWSLNGYYDDTKWIFWDKPVLDVNGVKSTSWGEATNLLMTCQDEASMTFMTNMTYQDTFELKGLNLTNLILRSASGCGPYVLSERNNNTQMMKLNQADLTLRLEDIVLRQYASSESAVLLVQAGRVELGAGSVLEGGGCALVFDESNTTGVMEDGAVIRNCHQAAANSWACGVRVGNYQRTGVRFEMRGGVISNCVNASTSAASGGYGGTVYVYCGTFEMTGGSVTENRSTGSSAGVLVYNGTARFGGTANVTGNVGTSPDLYVCNNGAVVVTGDLRGRIGVSSGSQTAGAALARISLETGATGAWSFYGISSGTATGFIGKTNESNPTQILWASPAGSVGGTAIASAQDASRALPKTLSVTADWEPLVFSGVATQAAGTVAVTFDPAELEAAERVPLTLFTAENGAFTSELVCALEPTMSGWTVRRRSDARILDRKRGGVLIFR